MRRGINRLRALQIERFKGPGKLSDGNGLYLVIGRNGSRTWVFRYTRKGKAVELGLGAVASVPSNRRVRRRATCAVPWPPVRILATIAIGSAGSLP